MRWARAARHVPRAGAAVRAGRADAAVQRAAARDEVKVASAVALTALFDADWEARRRHRQPIAIVDVR